MTKKNGLMKVNGLMEGNTVIYQVGHLGFLINCMLHKLCYHKDSKAIFLLDKVIANDITVENLVRRQEAFAYLGRFYFYDDREIIVQIASSDNAEDIVIKYFDEFFGNIGFALGTAENIYSTFDTFNSFGVYLNLKKLEFGMIECLSQQCQSHKRYNLNKNVTAGYDDILFKYKALSADSEYCRVLYAYDDSSLTDRKAVPDNAPCKLLQMLPREEIDRLVGAYGLDFKCCSDEEYFIYILNSSWWSGQQENQFNSLGQRGLYFYGNQAVCDYFVHSDNLIIKLHPNTDFEKNVIEKNFPGAKIIPGYFPSFLIEYIPNLKVSKSVSTGSSGAKTVGICDNTVPFLFFGSFNLINKLYAAVEIAKYLGVRKENFFHYGIHNSIVWRIEKEQLGDELCSSWSGFDFNDNSVTIIDNVNWNPGDFYDRLVRKMRGICTNAVIIFLNTKNDYIFLDKTLEFLPYIYELRLRKIPLRPDTLENLNMEKVYVFCKEPEMLRKLSHFWFEKVNKYRGFEMLTDGISMDREKTDISIKTDYLFDKCTKSLCDFK